MPPHCWRFRVPGAASGGERDIRTQPIVCAGASWRLQLRVRDNGQLGLFLQAAAPPPADGWAVTFEFFLVGQRDDLMTCSRQPATHKFSRDGESWGFSLFTELSADYVRSMDSSVVVQLEVSPLAAGSELGALAGGCRARQATGYVGLKNQGATCYMNSLLQALFMLSPLRQSVYQLPSDPRRLCTHRAHAVSRQKRLPLSLALQNLFYKMQTSKVAVSTQELTRAFGWDSEDAFTQHDANEMMLILLESLDKGMKGTARQGHIESMCHLKLRSVVKCPKISFESSTRSSELLLQLVVKGQNNFASAMDKYCRFEEVEDYKPDGHDGTHSAQIGTTIESLPPLLFVQLLRMDIDMHTFDTCKLNNRFAFDEEVDMSRWVTTKGDQPNANRYRLVSVLVHSGSLNSGHYFAFARPSAEPDAAWYRFDDEKVTPATPAQAIEENFGFDTPPSPSPREGLSGAIDAQQMQVVGRKVTQSYRARCTSAYMLVYARISDIDTLLAPMKADYIPKPLRLALESSRVAEERYRDAQLHCYIYVIVSSVFYQPKAGQTVGECDCTRIRVRRDATLIDVVSQSLHKLDAGSDVQSPDCQIWRFGSRGSVGAWRPGEELGCNMAVSSVFSRELSAIDLDGHSSEQRGLCALYVCPGITFSTPRAPVNSSQSNPAEFVQEPHAPTEEFLGSNLVIFKRLDQHNGVLTPLGTVSLPPNSTLSDCRRSLQQLQLELGLSSSPAPYSETEHLVEEVAPCSFELCEGCESLPVASGTIFVTGANSLLDGKAQDELDEALVALQGWTLWSQAWIERITGEEVDKGLYTSCGNTTMSNNSENAQPDFANIKGEFGTLAEWIDLHESVVVTFVHAASEDRNSGSMVDDVNIDEMNASGNNADVHMHKVFKMRFSTKDTYDDLAVQVASYLNFSAPLNLRFATCTDRQAMLNEVTNTTNFATERFENIRMCRRTIGKVIQSVGSMLQAGHQSKSTLLYQLGSVSLKQLESSAGVATISIHAGKQQFNRMCQIIPEDETVATLLNRLVPKLPTKFWHNSRQSSAQSLRLVSTLDGRVRKLYQHDECLSRADLRPTHDVWVGSDASTQASDAVIARSPRKYPVLRVEQIPAAELSLLSGDQLSIEDVGWKRICVQHCVHMYPVVQTFNEPVLVVVTPVDTVATVRSKLRKLWCTSGHNAAKWDFAILQYSKSERPVDDNTHIFSELDHFKTGVTYAGQYGTRTLGLSHDSEQEVPGGGPKLFQPVSRCSADGPSISPRISG